MSSGAGGGEGACAAPAPNPRSRIRPAARAAKRRRGAQRPAPKGIGTRKAGRRATLPARRGQESHPERRPARAERHPSAARPPRAASSSPFWPTASSGSGERVARMIETDGLRLGEITAAPNGGKAAVLARLRDGAIKRHLRGGRPSAKPAQSAARPMKLGKRQRPKRSRISVFSAVTVNRPQCETDRETASPTTAAARASSRVKAFCRRSSARPSHRRSGGAHRRQTSGAPLFAVPGHVERKRRLSAAPVGAENGKQRHERRHGQRRAGAAVVFKEIQRGDGGQLDQAEQAVRFHKAARSGLGTSASSSRTTSPALTPARRALAETIRRCAQTGSNTACTSSLTAKARPSRYARALAIRQRSSAPRGLTPTSTFGCSRGGHRQPGDVIEQRVAGLHGAHIGLHRQQFLAREHLLDCVQRVFERRSRSSAICAS